MKIKKETQETLVKHITQLDEKSKEFNAGRARKAIKLVNQAWGLMEPKEKLEYINLLTKSISLDL